MIWELVNLKGSVLVAGRVGRERIGEGYYVQDIRDIVITLSSNRAN